MNLRTKLILYLLFIHIVFAGTTYFLFLENRYYLFAIEAFFLISFLIAIILIRTLFKPLDIIRTGTEIIKEKDFTSKFQEVGQPEMDELIG
ncbi:MAG: histidine kinase, partial [Patescibacteria group bacterium]|nr:histidine kinase [Patescibacteria group bacterium]